MERLLHLIWVALLFAVGLGCLGLTALMVFASYAPDTVIMWIFLGIVVVLLFRPKLMGSITDFGALFLFCMLFGKYLWVLTGILGVIVILYAFGQLGRRG